MIGYMWLDGSNKKLEDRILDGYKFYAKKYGNIFERCDINSQCPDVVVEGLEIGKSKTVLANHFYYIIKKELDKEYINPNIEKDN